MSTIEISFLISRDGEDAIYQVVARVARNNKMFGPPQKLFDGRSYSSARAAHLRALHAAEREDWMDLEEAHAPRHGVYSDGR